MDCLEVDDMVLHCMVLVRLVRVATSQALMDLLRIPGLIHYWVLTVASLMGTYLIRGCYPLSIEKNYVGSV